MAATSGSVEDAGCFGNIVSLASRLTRVAGPSPSRKGDLRTRRGTASTFLYSRHLTHRSNPADTNAKSCVHWPALGSGSLLAPPKYAYDCRSQGPLVVKAAPSGSPPIPPGHHRGRLGYRPL